MEKSVELLSALLKTDASELSEKLSSEEGFQEIENNIKELKVYTNSEFANITNNLRDGYKDAVYGEIKGTVLEMFEKDLVKSHPELADLKRGEDYKNALELAAKLKSVQGGDNEDAQKEIAALQEMLRTKTAEYEQNLNDFKANAERERIGVIKKAELSKLKKDVDLDDAQVDGQMNLFSIFLDQTFEVRKNGEGQDIVWDLSKDEAVKNDDFSYASYAQVVKGVAPQFFKMKDVLAPKGRGSELKHKQPTSRINPAKYDNDFDVFHAKEIKGKGLSASEQRELFLQFQEALG